MSCNHKLNLGRTRVSFDFAEGNLDSVYTVLLIEFFFVFFSFHFIDKLSTDDDVALYLFFLDKML